MNDLLLAFAMTLIAGLSTGIGSLIAFLAKRTSRRFLSVDVYKRQLKDCFQQQLSAALNLTRVSAPLFVRKDTGLNDDLCGVERKVAFDALEAPGEEIQVVQSLAKWKRYALGK